MTWEYIPSDRNTLDHLHDILWFYEETLGQKKHDLHKAMQYAKYGLPNWRNEIIKREVGVEDVERSIENVKQAILEWKQ